MRKRVLVLFGFVGASRTQHTTPLPKKKKQLPPTKTNLGCGLVHLLLSGFSFLCSLEHLLSSPPFACFAFALLKRCLWCVLWLLNWFFFFFFVCLLGWRLQDTTAQKRYKLAPRFPGHVLLCDGPNTAIGHGARHFSMNTLPCKQRKNKRQRQTKSSNNKQQKSKRKKKNFCWLVPLLASTAVPSSLLFSLLGLV